MEDDTIAEVTPFRKTQRPFLFAVILLIAVLGGILYYFRAAFVAAMVNGEPITRIAVVRELEKQAGARALDSLVTETLIMQEARKKNISVNEKDIDTEVKKLDDSLKSQGQQLDQVLLLQGMTRERLREQIKIQKIVEKVLANKINVSDKEASDFIAKSKEDADENTKIPSKEEAKEQLKQQKLQKEFQTWLENVKKNAKISTFVNY